MNCETTTALVGLIGVLVGGLIGHWRAIGLAKADRKRNFIAWMAQLRAQARGEYQTGGFFIFHRDKITNFDHAISLIRGDIPKTKRVDFEKLVAEAFRFDRGKKEDENQKRIVESIDELVSFVESN